MLLTDDLVQEYCDRLVQKDSIVLNDEMKSILEDFLSKLASVTTKEVREKILCYLKETIECACVDGITDDGLNYVTEDIVSLVTPSIRRQEREKILSFVNRYSFEFQHHYHEHKEQVHSHHEAEDRCKFHLFGHLEMHVSRNWIQVH